MSINESVLLLGSDLGNREKNLKEAKSFIIQEVGPIKKESKIMETEAIGFASELDFLNQTIIVETNLSPFSLLNTIKGIERKMGRIYKEPKENEHYTSRIIDIDILFYDKMIIECNKLQIPHKQIYTRKFVQILLEDLA